MTELRTESKYYKLNNIAYRYNETSELQEVAEKLTFGVILKLQDEMKFIKEYLKIEDNICYYTHIFDKLDAMLDQIIFRYNLKQILIDLES